MSGPGHGGPADGGSGSEVSSQEAPPGDERAESGAHEGAASPAARCSCSRPQHRAGSPCQVGNTNRRWPLRSRLTVEPEVTPEVDESAMGAG